LPSNPYERSFPLDRAEHEVRVDAKGYVPRTEHIVLERDTELAVELTEERARASERLRGGERARVMPSAPRRPASLQANTPPQAKAAGAAPAGGPNCEKPFFIDERGIKRMLPECL
jgi:hypothetical protein